MDATVAPQSVRLATAGQPTVFFGIAAMTRVARRSRARLVRRASPAGGSRAAPVRRSPRSSSAAHVRASSTCRPSISASTSMRRTSRPAGAAASTPSRCGSSKASTARPFGQTTGSARRAHVRTDPQQPERAGDRGARSRETPVRKRARVTIRRQPFTRGLVKVNTSLGGTDSVTVNLCRIRGSRDRAAGSPHPLNRSPARYFRSGIDGDGGDAMSGAELRGELHRGGDVQPG